MLVTRRDSPGGKTYGAMTVLIKYYAHPRPLLKVLKDAFNPKLKVDSMVIELDFEKPYPRLLLNNEATL